MAYSKRADRYKRKTRSEEPTNVLGIIQIDNILLNLFLCYVLSQNSTIHKSGLTSLNRLLKAINESYFATNQIMAAKYQILCILVENRINGIRDRNILLSIANRYVDIAPVTADPMATREISTDEVNLVESTVAEFLNNMYLNQNIAVFKDLITGYEQADFRQKTSYLPQIRDAASKMLTQFRKNDASKDTADTLFRLSDMPNRVADIHQYVTSPTFKLITGCQALNGMLGGGAEPGNVYAFFGLPGEGKTTTLENMLVQLWKYNKGYVCKDRTKKPCIVLLTMENFVRQTVCAIYNILTHGKQLRDCATAQEAIDEFKAHSFEYNPEDENAIEIVIKFKPINSVDTDYMYKIVENLEDEGFECIAFLQDYVKRIRPVFMTNDPYQDLGNIINEFKTFATLKNIPVITASQLNRDAAKIIDEGRNANKADLIKKLGRSNIGESARIDENLDGTFIITPEVSSDGLKFLGVKLTKHRYEIHTTKVSIYQPYVPNSIALVEDVYDVKPAFRESLMRDAEEIRQSFGEVERASINRTVKALEGLTANNEMMQPGMVLRPKIKKETQHGFNTEALVAKKELIQVVECIDPKDAERLREKYGIKKVV